MAGDGSSRSRVSDDDHGIEGLAGTTLDARFKLESFVARGGYGAVYRSTHPALGCPVAIKVLAVHEAPGDALREQFAEAFEKEARLVAALQHPAIVRALDVGVTPIEGRAHPFMVMEWLDGATLETSLRARANRRHGPREAFELLRPVFDAIASAHEAGVVHRDLKPANIMVTVPRRGVSATKVLDFGVAKALRADEAAPNPTERTGDATSAFSLSHAAPEQVGRLRTGPWTDVHALALLLVEALVGERAYRGRTTIELFAAISAPVRPTPGTFCVEVGPWELVLARALSIDPTARHAHASELLSALDATLDDAQRAWEAAADRPSAPPLDETWRPSGPAVAQRDPVAVVRPTPTATTRPVRNGLRRAVAAAAALVALFALAAGALVARHRGAPTTARRATLHASTSEATLPPAPPAAMREFVVIPAAPHASPPAPVPAPPPRIAAPPRRSPRPPVRAPSPDEIAIE